MTYKSRFKKTLFIIFFKKVVTYIYTSKKSLEKNSDTFTHVRSEINFA